MEDNLIVKILLIGDSSSGKTTLMHKLVGGKSRPTYLPTVSASFEEIVTRNNTFQVWDTAGRSIFKHLSRLYYRNANCLAVVFDLSKSVNRRDIKAWLSYYFTVDTAKENKCPVFIIGNKLDLCSNKATKANTGDISKYADLKGYSYAEVSALSGENLGIVFKDMMAAGLRNLEIAMNRIHISQEESIDNRKKLKRRRCCF